MAVVSAGPRLSAWRNRLMLSCQGLDPAFSAASSHAVSDLIGPASRAAEWLLLSLSECAGLSAG